MEIDALDPRFYDDPWEAYRWLRHHSPVHWDATNELWLISKHEDVCAISRDQELYSAAQGEVDSGALDQQVFDDIAWARYPRVIAGEPSAPPLGGINLAIGNFTDHPDEALEAVRCITSVESTTQYMIEAGNPAARDAVYDDPEVREVFPMADLIRDSINEAGPRPITPYYGDVSNSVQRTWHPPSGVSAPDTPEETDSFMSEVLSGERLL